MNPRIRELLSRGYTPVAIAMDCGGPVGTTEYYRILDLLEPNRQTGCSYCGEPCFGTGDCNCMDD